MPHRADACGTIDREARVAVLGTIGLSRVHPHTDADGDPLGPGVLRELPLGTSRTLDGVTRATERNEERIALRTPARLR